jgi:hypothetical protein
LSLRWPCCISEVFALEEENLSRPEKKRHSYGAHHTTARRKLLAGKEFRRSGGDALGGGSAFPELAAEIWLYWAPWKATAHGVCCMTAHTRCAVF